MEPTLIDETKDMFVINKPAGFSVEKHQNYPSIADWLSKRYSFKDVPTGELIGIVHRLDVETSGVMVWAKTPEAQSHLRELWQGRQVKKTYLALVTGEIEPEGKIELSITRDNRNDRQAVAWLPSVKSRPAITEYRRMAVGEYSQDRVSLVEAHPVTGRTHQLRVHLKAIGHPIVGDGIYGEKKSDQTAKNLGLNRQFLHALSIEIPQAGKFTAPLTADLVQAMTKCGITIGP